MVIISWIKKLSLNVKISYDESVFISEVINNGKYPEMEMILLNE